MQLTKTEYTPLIRTDFADPGRWQALVAAVTTPSADGFWAMTSVIHDPAMAGATADDICVAATHLGILPLIIIADATAMATPDFPLLCIEPASGRSVRVIASELWGIENNLSIGNMDFGDFANATGTDGIFRGFA